MGTHRPFQFETEREIWVAEILSSECADVWALYTLYRKREEGIKGFGLIIGSER